MIASSNRSDRRSRNHARSSHHTEPTSPRLFLTISNAGVQKGANLTGKEILARRKDRNNTVFFLRVRIMGVKRSVLRDSATMSISAQLSREAYRTKGGGVQHSLGVWIAYVNHWYVDGRT